jgi:hypothetical protein
VVGGAQGRWGVMGYGKKVTSCLEWGEGISRNLYKSRNGEFRDDAAKSSELLFKMHWAVIHRCTEVYNSFFDRAIYAPPCIAGVKSVVVKSGFPCTTNSFSFGN